MKAKKLLSVFTAGALAVTMAMPVMAADGGEINVDVTTQTGILRVAVPTTLAIAVDQFETTTAGTQIHSEPFTIANQSEVNVKVAVTSTATLKTGVELAAERDAVNTAAPTAGKAWLAVAAKKNATNYQADSGNDDLSALDETAANVTTFAKNGTAVTAAQTFYLKKGTGSATYKLLVPEADGKTNGKTYSQFYKLTAQTTPSNLAGLQTLVDAGDIYWEVTASGGNDGGTLTKIAKGSTAAASDFNAANTYYTVATTPTAVASLKSTELYVYGELAKDSTGADAAFRYIGALSSNKEAWSATDISKIKIAYTIQGLPQSAYDEAVTDGITYGLYKEKVAANYTVLNGGYWVSLDGSNGFAAAPTSLTVGGTALTAGTDYTFEKSGWIKLASEPDAGSAIEFVISGTTYRVTVPTE